MIDFPKAPPHPRQNMRRSTPARQVNPPPGLAGDPREAGNAGHLFDRLSLWLADVAAEAKLGGPDAVDRATERGT